MRGKGFDTIFSPQAASKHYVKVIFKTKLQKFITIKIKKTLMEIEFDLYAFLLKARWIWCIQVVVGARTAQQSITLRLTI